MCSSTSYAGEAVEFIHLQACCERPVRRMPALKAGESLRGEFQGRDLRHLALEGFLRLP